MILRFILFVFNLKQLFLLSITILYLTLLFMPKCLPIAIMAVVLTPPFDLIPFIY